MSNTAQIAQAFSEIRDVLRADLSPDATAECQAVLFFLKRASDAGIPLNSPDLGGGSLHLGQVGWFQLAQHSARRDAFLSLLRVVENSVPEADGLGTDSKFAMMLKAGTIRDSHLKQICYILDRVSLRELTTNEASGFFQDLLEAPLDRAATSVTPESVRRIMVGLLFPRSGSSIYDPVCRYGSLLCDAARAATRDGNTPRIFGQDVETGLTLLARMNTMLGGWKADIRTGDTLTAPRHVNDDGLQKFDLIVANPPFGVRLKYEHLQDDPYGRFEGTPSSSELAFVQHVDHSLAENGRGVILVPNGILFRSGHDYAVRKRLIESDRLQAVISLPPYLFPGTPISVSVLFLNARKSAAIENHVIFVDLREHGEGQKTRRHISDDGISAAMRCVLGGSAIASFSAVVRHGDIIANNYDLSVGRYVRIRKDDGLRSFAEEKAAFAAAIAKRNRAEAEALRLLDLAGATSTQKELGE